MFDRNYKNFDEILNNFSEIFGENLKRTAFNDSVITSTEEGWNVELLTPGFTKDELSIKVDNNYLKIEGEVKEDEGSKLKKNFKKTYTLPQKVKIEKIDAKLENGILFLNIKKSVDENIYEVKIK